MTTEKKIILALAKEIEEWGEENGIATSVVEQFELAERLLRRLESITQLQEDIAEHQTEQLRGLGDAGLPLDKSAVEV